MSRKRWGAAVVAGALLTGLSVAVPAAQAHDHRGGNAVRTVGYYTQWSQADRGIPARYLVENGSAAKLTHLNYAFGLLDEQGGCVSSDPRADYQRLYSAEESVSGKADKPGQALAGNLNQLKQLKQKFPRLRVYISLGGWIGSAYFSNAALTPQSRAAHVKSCIDLWLKGNLPGAPAGAAKGVFDGIDLDWEWPSTEGNVGNVVRPEDKQNFTKLLREYRTQLNKQGAKDRRVYDLTAFLPANREAMDRGYEMAEVYKLLTFATVQGYDYHGAWERTSNQQSALRVPEGDPTTPKDSGEIVVDAYLERGAPRHKITLGVPYFGRGWTGLPNQNNGLFQQSTGPAPGSYEAGYEDYRTLKPLLAGGKFKLYRDDKAGHAYLFDGTTFWNYDDPTELKRKGKFIRDRKLGGAMIWALDGDTPQGELTKALDAGLRRR
ncbi:glycoside hydrolase family 18 protein [Actinosynnema sp. NPDC047251]|uniref:chitinase n=1 Tax=Saccharothrix espanaensis (strain ATCC 51144 / DSM 44229 / JCM 9112 / NBRC 15066 / NRRL 15764) TaxID=1179773 RepID=K0JTG6_SACES|nr:glycoside hydrolase family 18 protein [Saccharothrix espanaensis]CCH31080.1 Chitinase [Saccharothrix espanaensis DSM 44229]